MCLFEYDMQYSNSKTFWDFGCVRFITFSDFRPIQTNQDSNLRSRRVRNLSHFLVGE